MSIVGSIWAPVGLYLGPVCALGTHVGANLGSDPTWIYVKNVAYIAVPLRPCQFQFGDPMELLRLPSEQCCMHMPCSVPGVCVISLTEKATRTVRQYGPPR